MAAKKKKAITKKFKRSKIATSHKKSITKNNNLGIFNPDKIGKVYLAKLHDLEKYVRILRTKFNLKGIIR